MDLSDIIIDIENNTDPVTRCISYAELIIHLKYIKQTLDFPTYRDNWRNMINERVRDMVNEDIDKEIREITNLISHDIKK